MYICSYWIPLEFFIYYCIFKWKWASETIAKWCGYKDYRFYAEVDNFKDDLERAYCGLIYGLTMIVFNIKFSDRSVLTIHFPDYVYYGATIVALVGLYGVIRVRFMLGNQWSQGSGIFKNHVLFTNGPFAIDRHPMFCGIFMMMLSACIFNGNIINMILTLYCLHVMRKKAEYEEEQLEEVFGEKWTQYQADVDSYLFISDDSKL